MALSSLNAPGIGNFGAEGGGGGVLGALLQLASTLACLAVAFAGGVQLQGTGGLQLA